MLCKIAVAAVPFAALLLVAASEPPAPKQVPEFTTFTRLQRSTLMRMPKRDAWQDAVPAARQVTIRSTADGVMQKAMFYDSGSPAAKPLLVALHSWSDDFEQQSGIPFALWAARNDWVFIHPDFRGRCGTPQGTASDLAIQDVVDAREYARAHARVDDARIYLVGFSGGAMTALVVVGRHPDLWTAVSAWVPVYDLVQWYGETRGKYPRYAAEITRACGGEPLRGSEAEAECLRRSPSSYLAAARGHRVHVYLATGIDDPFVSPEQTLQAFNALASQPDRVDAAELLTLVRARVPAGSLPSVDPEYQAAGRPLLLEHASERVTVRIFKGRHDVIYNAGLLWLSRQSL